MQVLDPEVQLQDLEMQDSEVQKGSSDTLIPTAMTALNRELLRELGVLFMCCFCLSLLCVVLCYTFCIVTVWFCRGIMCVKCAVGSPCDVQLLY